MNYYNMNNSKLIKELDTSLDGLDSEDAKNRIQKYGENKIIEAKKKTKIRIFLEQFNDMMIIILIIVALIMYIYGLLISHDYTDTIVIAVVVFINAIMGYVQQEKAEVTLDGLKSYTTSTCKVRRDGKIIKIDTNLIVPGDILILEAGDKIPADARVIKESNLLVDESPLTGESVPVKKTLNALKGKLQIQDQTNMIFCGSNITNGIVEAIVVKTGMMTELGLIAVSLNTPYEVETPLENKIKEISKKLTIIIFFILIFMFIYGLVKGYKIFEIIMLCVSLAVAAIPEGLPAVITIALSVGASSLATKKAVIRQMSAVETLGATDVICSDKTGTITQNKMKIKKTNITNDEMFKYISLLCNETIIDGKKYIGEPTESCMYDYQIDLGENPIKVRKKHKRILYAPFDSDRKLMSTVNSIDGKYYVLVKGSVENLLNLCTKIEDVRVRKITYKDKKEILANENKYAQDALRVIGFAYRELKKLPKDGADLLKNEKDLIFIGMVGIIDSPRDSIASSVAKCHKAGIRPIMITGDSLVTACAIAKEVGIIKSDNEGLIGRELDKYSDEELVEVVKHYGVYARVSPDHKRRIVAAWQKNDKVVAMTGDGVNDAPAIKDAHVGIGMGITGTEVTKSVADIILLDDSFSTIVDATEEGRKIYSNIRNNVVYSLSSNFAEIIAVLVGMFTGNTILLPIHILFIDLVTDSIPSICLSFEGAEKDIMDKPPRGINTPLFTPFIKSTIAFSSIVESLFVLIVFFASLKFYNAEIASTLALLSMVMQEIIYAISCRNLKEYIYKMGLFKNKVLNKGLLIVIIVELLIFLTPIGNIIKVCKVSLPVLCVVVAFNLLGFLLYELIKPIFKKCFKD